MLRDAPLVSVLMPVRNEEAHIERSLGAVLAQDYPRERLQILVVDGMSEDATREMIRRLGKEHDQLELIDNPDRIVPTALNLGLRRSRGEIVVRVDGHCEIAPDYIRRCVGWLRQGIDDAGTRLEVHCVGGPIETVAGSPAAAAIAIGMSSPFGVGGAAFRTHSGAARLVDTVAFGAYTRQALAQTGLFDEELVRNEDDEYNYRLRAWGGRILLAPDVRSRYFSRGSLRRLWSQYLQYGFWKVRVLQKCPRQMQPRHFAPPLFVASLLLGVALSLWSWIGWALFAGVGGAYAAANLAAAAATARRRGWRHLPRLPWVFAALHSSYGLGFLAGLGRFWNRWRDRRGKIPSPMPLAGGGE